eukprot:4081720-Karenia_brevis.AAC.1
MAEDGVIIFSAHNGDGEDSQQSVGNDIKPKDKSSSAGLGIATDGNTDSVWRHDCWARSAAECKKTQ